MARYRLTDAARQKIRTRLLEALERRKRNPELAKRESEILRKADERDFEAMMEVWDRPPDTEAEDK